MGISPGALYMLSPTASAVAVAAGALVAGALVAAEVEAVVGPDVAGVVPVCVQPAVMATISIRLIISARLLCFMDICLLFMMRSQGVKADGHMG
jgi:hypothetical protein